MVKRLNNGMALLAVLGAAVGCGGDDSMSGEMHMPNAGTTGHVDENGLPFVPCETDKPPVAVNLEATGDDGVMKARLVDAFPLPPEKYRNDWTVDVMDMEGTPLQDVEMTMAQAFMPAHNHDGRMTPEITPLEESGRFQVDNLNLWMRGPWEIRLWVSSQALGDDYIVFDACVEE